MCVMLFGEMMLFVMVPEVSPVERRHVTRQINIPSVKCDSPGHLEAQVLKVPALWLQAHLVRLGLDVDLAVLPALDSLHLQLLSLGHKTGCAGVKGAVLGLQALLLGFAEVGSRHLCIAAHVVGT